jgi:hypothetical protein
MKLTSWQVRRTLLICTVGPPLASLILMTVNYLPSYAARTEGVDVPSFLAALVLFAVPVGYVFGLVPAVFAGVMYCGVLTAMATLRPGMLLRACIGALCGGSAGEVWFPAMIGPDSHGYGWVAALVVALLALYSHETSTATTRSDSMSVVDSKRAVSAVHPPRRAPCSRDRRGHGRRLEMLP